jgi:hypothetical protein
LRRAAEDFAAGNRRAPGWLTPIAYLFALFPAGVLIVAAFFKAGDPGLFAAQITAHRVTPEAWSPWLAYLFIAAELGLAAALIAFVWPRVVFGLTIFLMLFFIGVTAWAWSHGNAEACGCFGRLTDRTPRAVIVEDAVIVVTSTIGLLLSLRIPTPYWRWTVFGLLLIPALVLTAFGSVLPIDSTIVGIRPGANLSSMAIEGAAPPLEEGRVLLALVGPRCDACEDGVGRLKRVADDANAPQVLAVYAGKPGAAQAWRLEHVPNFPVASAPEKSLRQYYRRLPVTFLLENGIVRRVWWGRMPAVEELPR